MYIIYHAVHAYTLCVPVSISFFFYLFICWVSVHYSTSICAHVTSDTFGSQTDSKLNLKTAPKTETLLGAAVVLVSNQQWENMYCTRCSWRCWRWQCCSESVCNELAGKSFVKFRYIYPFILHCSHVLPLIVINYYYCTSESPAFCLVSFLVSQCTPWKPPVRAVSYRIYFSANIQF